MRQIVGTAQEFSNMTWPANTNATLALTSFAVVGCILGVPANLFVILISIFSTKIVGDYKYFIANLAVCDLSFCFSALFQCVFHLYHQFWNVPMNVTKCSWQTQVPYAAGLCVGFAIPLPSVNRYVAIVLNKDAWFEKKRTIILLCLTSYFPILYLIVANSFAPYVVYYPYCNYELYIPYTIEILFAYVIVIVYPAIMYLNYSIYRVLANHMHSATTLNKTASQMENERSILKAIVIQGAIPVFSAFPFGMVLIAVFFYGWQETTVVLFHLSDDLVLTLADVCLCIFVTTPTIDALVDLIIMKDYRAAYNDILRRLQLKLSGQNATETSITPADRQNPHVAHGQSTGRSNHVRTRIVR